MRSASFAMIGLACGKGRFLKALEYGRTGQQLPLDKRYLPCGARSHYMSSLIAKRIHMSEMQIQSDDYGVLNRLIIVTQFPALLNST